MGIVVIRNVNVLMFNLSVVPSSPLSLSLCTMSQYTDSFSHSDGHFIENDSWLSDHKRHLLID